MTCGTPFHNIKVIHVSKICQQEVLVIGRQATHYGFNIFSYESLSD